MVPTECVNLLGKLISHPTINPGGDETELATFLEQQLKVFTPDELAVVSVPRAGESGAYVWARFGTPKTVINVHLDTVEVASGWTRDPFVMSQDNGRLYGLGTADTKGAIACVLTALGHANIKDIGILFSGDEERSSTVIEAFLNNTSTNGVGDIERVIVCEPTSRGLGIRHRGIRSYHLSTSGSGGHSSRADDSPKPLVVCARLAIELDTLGERYLDIGPQGMQGLCLNIAKIGTPVPFNVIAERGELIFSVRPPPGFDGDRFAAEIGTCIRRAISGEVSPISTHCVLNRPPFATLDPSRFTDLAGADPLAAISLDFWTEAALWSAHGIDAVVIGPGDIAVAHGPDEYVTIDDLEWATAIFQRLLQKTAQG